MCNGTWVCFDRRIALRRPTWRHISYVRPWLIGDNNSGRVRFPECHEACAFLGPAIEIPPKDDTRAWIQFRSKIQELQAVAVDSRVKQKARKTHDLEQRIRELAERPKSAGRDVLNKKLRAELDSIPTSIQ